MTQAACSKVVMYFRAGESDKIQEGKEEANAGIHASICLNPGIQQLSMQMLKNKLSASSYAAPGNTVLPLTV